MTEAAVQKIAIPEGTIVTDSKEKKWIVGASLDADSCQNIYAVAPYHDDDRKPKDYTGVVIFKPHGNASQSVTKMQSRICDPKAINKWKRKKKLRHLGVTPILGAGIYECNDETYLYTITQRYAGNVKELLDKNEEGFILLTIYRVIGQILYALEYINSKGYYGMVQINSEKLLQGFNNPNDIYLDVIDYGQVPESSTFKSRESHAKTAYGDLESVLYNILHWMKRELPWQNNLTDEVTANKQKIEAFNDVNKFLRDVFGIFAIPAPIYHFMIELATRNTASQPDYNKFRLIVAKGIQNVGNVHHNLDSSLNFDEPLKLRKNRSYAERASEIDPQCTKRRQDDRVVSQISTKKGKISRVSKQTRRRKIDWLKQSILIHAPKSNPDELDLNCNRLTNEKDTFKAADVPAEENDTNDTALGTTAVKNSNNEMTNQDNSPVMMMTSRDPSPVHSPGTKATQNVTTDSVSTTPTKELHPIELELITTTSLRLQRGSKREDKQTEESPATSRCKRMKVESTAKEAEVTQEEDTKEIESNKEPQLANLETISKAGTRACNSNQLKYDTRVGNDCVAQSLNESEPQTVGSQAAENPIEAVYVTHLKAQLVEIFEQRLASFKLGRIKSAELKQRDGLEQLDQAHEKGRNETQLADDEQSSKVDELPKKTEETLLEKDARSDSDDDKSKDTKAELSEKKRKRERTIWSNTEDSHSDHDKDETKRKNAEKRKKRGDSKSLSPPCDSDRKESRSKTSSKRRHDSDSDPSSSRDSIRKESRNTTSFKRKHDSDSDLSPLRNFSKKESRSNTNSKKGQDSDSDLSPPRDSSKKESRSKTHSEGRKDGNVDVSSSERSKKRNESSSRDRRSRSRETNSSPPRQSQKRDNSKSYDRPGPHKPFFQRSNLRYNHSIKWQNSQWGRGRGRGMAKTARQSYLNRYNNNYNKNPQYLSEIQRSSFPRKYYGRSTSPESPVASDQTKKTMSGGKSSGSMDLQNLTEEDKEKKCRKEQLKKTSGGKSDHGEAKIVRDDKSRQDMNSRNSKTNFDSDFSTPTSSKQDSHRSKMHSNRRLKSRWDDRSDQRSQSSDRSRASSTSSKYSDPRVSSSSWDNGKKMSRSPRRNARPSSPCKNSIRNASPALSVPSSQTNKKKTSSGRSGESLNLQNPTGENKERKCREEHSKSVSKENTSHEQTTIVRDDNSRQDIRTSMTNCDCDPISPINSKQEHHRARKHSKQGSKSRWDDRSERSESSERSRVKSSRWDKERTKSQSPSRIQRSSSPCRSTSPVSSVGSSETESSKMLDEKSSCLTNLETLLEEAKGRKREEEDSLKNVSREDSDSGHAIIERDLKQKAAEDQGRQKKWVEGLKQGEDRETRLKEDLEETNKPLARHANDEHLEPELHAIDREEDFVLAYVREKDVKEAKRVPEKPKYVGSYMPNRFGIKPGHRWDGVDRTNGYEMKWFVAQNAKKVLE